MSVALELLQADLNVGPLYDEPAEKLQHLPEEPDEELEELVVRAQEGDETAVLRVGRAIEKKAYESVSFFISDPEDLATLATEGLNRALENGIVNKQYSRYYTKKGKSGEKDVVEGGFKGWVWRVVRNNTINEINRRKREAGRYTKFPDEYMDNLPDPHKTEDISEEHEGYELVNGLLMSVDELTEDQRDVIRLRLLGYEFQEVGEILGIPEGTALSRHARGIKKLRGHFEAPGQDRTPDIFANVRPTKLQRKP